MLRISYPNDAFSSERKYIINLLIAEFLGIEYELDSTESPLYISIKAKGKKIVLNDSFFTIAAKEGWLSENSLPRTPLSSFQIKEKSTKEKLESSHIPVIYGEACLSLSDSEINLGIDIFGSCFFMLSRYEEAVISIKDTHGRFPAYESLAYRENFISRPIVNEYLEILWFYMSYMWPELKRKKRSYRTIVSCDVDTPFDSAYYSAFNVSKRMLADIAKRRNFKTAVATYKNYKLIKKLGRQVDPYFTNIYYISDFLKKHNLHGAFFFICGNSAGAIDSDYDITQDRLVQKLIVDLVDKGHEIGLHGSYNTYNSYDQLLTEYQTLIKVMRSLDIESPTIGGRQHYLRWESPGTAILYDRVGLAYDTSLTYAAQAGFRAGVCYEYPLYDLSNRRELITRERPLIAMEGSIIQKKYMGLGHGEQAVEYIKHLKHQCKIYEGDFTLLWHNSFLNSESDYLLFEKAILS